MLFIQITADEKKISIPLMGFRVFLVDLFLFGNDGEEKISIPLMGFRVFLV